MVRIGMLSKLLKYLSIPSNRASIGIGSMIIFIAMILVAGIAASVLIGTSNTLETQAMQSGKGTRNEVSSGIRVYQIIGNYNARNVSGTICSRFHNMSIIVTPCSGTDGINLGEAIIQIANNSKICVLSYANVLSSSPSGNGIFSMTSLFDLNASEFSIIVIDDRDGSCTQNNPIINGGDKVLLNINLTACFGGLRGKEDVQGMVIVEEGAPGPFLFRTPGTTSKAVTEFM